MRKNIKRSLKRKQRREQASASLRDEDQHKQTEITGSEGNPVEHQESSVQNREPKEVREPTSKVREQEEGQSRPDEVMLESRDPSEETVEMKGAAKPSPKPQNSEKPRDEFSQNEEPDMQESSATAEKTVQGKPVDLAWMSKILGVKPVDYHSAGNTPAINAAIENDIDKFMELFSKSDINIPNYRGFTALHALVENGRADIIRTLGVRHLGPILNAQTHDDGVTPLILAVRSMRVDVCHALANTLRADIFLTDHCGYSALAHALHVMSITKNDIVVKILLESIDDGYYQYTSALNALGFAATSGMTGTTEFLIDRYGLDVNYPLSRFPQGDYVTPLMLASELNHIDIVALLIMKYNANPCPVHLCGDTALIRATITRSTDVVRYLCGLRNMRYVDLVMKNSWNQTAHSLAVNMHNLEIAQILEDALKEKHKEYCKARKKSQKRKAYQMRKQSKERQSMDSIKAYHPVSS